MSRNLTKTRPERIAPDNHKIIVDAIKAYMQRHHRYMSIDAIASQPLHALLLCIRTARAKNQLRNEGRWRQLEQSIERLLAQEPSDVDRLHNVMHRGMAARKRGNLKIGDYADAGGR